MCTLQRRGDEAEPPARGEVGQTEQKDRQSFADILKDVGDRPGSGRSSLPM